MYTKEQKKKYLNILNHEGYDNKTSEAIIDFLYDIACVAVNINIENDEKDNRKAA